MADDVTYLPDIPEAESTEVDNQSSVLGLIYNGVTPHTKRIKIEDVVKDVADDISDLSTTVSGLGDTISSLQSTATTLSNDIDAEEAKTTALNSLYGVVTSLAGSVGLTVSSTQDANNNYTAYSLNGNSADAYKPSDLSTWIRRIAQEIEGVTASKDASNVWSLPAYTTQVAMASTYSTDLRNKIDLENKQTNFDHSWTSGRSYSKGAVVIYNNQIYQCNTENSDSTFNSSKWTLIAAGGGGGSSELTRNTWHTLRNIVTEGLSYETLPASSLYMYSKKDSLAESENPWASYWEYEVMFPEVFPREYQYSSYYQTYYFNDYSDYEKLPIWNFKGNAKTDSLTNQYSYRDMVYSPETYSDYDARDDYYAMGYRNKEHYGSGFGTAEQIFDSSKRKFKQNILGMFNDVLKRYLLFNKEFQNEGKSSDAELLFKDYINYVGINPILSGQYDKEVYLQNRELQQITDINTQQERSETEAEALKRAAANTDPIYYEYADFINTLMQALTIQTLEGAYIANHEIDTTRILYSDLSDDNLFLNYNYIYLLELSKNPNDVSSFKDLEQQEFKKIVLSLDEEKVLSSFNNNNLFNTYDEYSTYLKNVLNNSKIYYYDLAASGRPFISINLESSSFMSILLLTNDQIFYDIPLTIEVYPGFVDTSAFGLSEIQDRIDHYYPSSSDPVKPKFYFKER